MQLIGVLWIWEELVLLLENPLSERPVSLPRFFTLFPIKLLQVPVKLFVGVDTIISLPSETVNLDV